jgi:hypothetical protein
MISWDGDSTASSVKPGPYVPGDHLRSPRTGYSHHGIYIGDGCVIHYSGFAKAMRKGSIAIATVSEFANCERVEIIPHPNRHYDRETSVQRAYKRLGEDWYNLVVNNCEHFANWCIEGKHESPQVTRVANTVVSASAFAHLRNNPSARNSVLAKLREYRLLSSAPTTDTICTSLPTKMAAQIPRAISYNAGGAMVSSIAPKVASAVGISYGIGVGTVAPAAATAAGLAAATLGLTALPAVALAGAGLGLVKWLWDD